MSKSDYLENKPDGRSSRFQVVVDGTKLCSRCEQRLPLDAFPPKPKAPSGREAACRACRKNYPSQSKVARNAVARRYWHRKGRPDFYRRAYGLSAEVYAEMVARQRGRCALCQEPPDAKGLVVDHCHTTGTTRALLCNGCNVGLGYFKDNPERLAAAIDYLRDHARV